MNRTRTCRLYRVIKKSLTIAAGIFFLWGGGLGYALDPDEILVIANSRMSGSTDLAHYYMKKRNISGDRLLTVSVSTNEVISREEYDKAVLMPVRNAVKKLQGESRIHCLVLFYGMPLKIDPSLSPQRQREMRPEIEQKDGGISKKGDDPPHKVERQKNEGAALDSEIALALVDSYPLDGWLENPYFLGFQNKKTLLQKDDVLMVSRLDGPDQKTVFRIINDTLAAEKTGLQGKGYFDARWPLPESKQLSGYALYDAAIHSAAKRAESRMPVRLDEREELFGPGECDNAALYCGWYSLGRYIDSFTWSKGAIGYHIASSECTTLKNTSSQVWCLKMLEKGVVATIGPVNEPYVQGFPLPDIFFGHLVEGYMSLGECYLISLPYLSWQMVLIGDPLYQPFKPPSSR
jgi:uncharacterized protein (TIGR03790 family)